MCEGVPVWVCVPQYGRVCPSEGLLQHRRVGGMCMCVCMCFCHMCSWRVRNVYKCTCA